MLGTQVLAVKEPTKKKDIKWPIEGIANKRRILSSSGKTIVVSILSIISKYLTNASYSKYRLVFNSCFHSLKKKN